MAAKVAEGQTTINSLKKYFNVTTKAADANALMAKQNADARINAADTNALMAKHHADARVNEADSYALRANQDAARTVCAERAVTSHTLRNIKKQHDRRLISPTNYANTMAAKVAEGQT